MKTVVLSGKVREKLGKSSSKEIRAADAVPCVLYGGETPVHFSSPVFEFKQLVYTPDAYLVKVNVGNQIFDAILQDLQFDPVYDQITHADFLQISQDKEVTIEIPIKVVGKIKGVLAGGSLSVILRKLKVRALPKDLPDFIQLDMTNIDLGGSFKVKELELPKGVEVLNSPEAVIAGVKITRTARLAAQQA